MTQTFTPITERIPLAPTVPGTIYAAGWTPRLDPQSPDLICPTDEHATLAELMRRAEDDRLTAEREQRDTVWAEAARNAAGEAETVTLAEVMPQPQARPDGYWARHRRPLPAWLWAVLAFAGGVVGGVTVLTAAVIQAGGPR